MARHIPKAVMPDTMQVFFKDYASDYDDGWLEPFEIENVRFERADQIINSPYKLSDGASGRVWIDAVNSKGATKIPIGSKVVINGESYIVNACNAYKCGKHIHHWELDVN